MDNNDRNQMFYILNEILYGMRFHDSIKDSFIPNNISLSFGGGAIDYVGAYTLFRILADFKPKRILELGMGQSTKIISSYVTNEKTHEIIHRVVEHDEEWIDFFCAKNKLSEKTELVKLDLQTTEEYSKENATYRYEGFLEELGDLCYDFVFVDGPYGWNKPEYSRIDCLDLIPNNISDSFVIMFHDVARRGEKRTLELLKETLESKKGAIRVKTFFSVGIIVSEDNKFLCWV